MTRFPISLPGPWLIKNEVLNKAEGESQKGVHSEWTHDRFFRYWTDDGHKSNNSICIGQYPNRYQK